VNCADFLKVLQMYFFIYLLLLNLLLFFHSSSDDTYHHVLVTILETVPIKNFVDRVVSKVLLSCMKMSQKNSNPSSQSGMLLAHVLEYFLGTYLCRHISEEVFEL
jgi:hypothetical protein